MYPGKRILDLGGAAMLLILTAPVSLAATLINLIVFKRIFFWQQRIGKDQKAFWMLKFQSMYNGQITPGWGRLIRKLSIDEIPQLWNVIRGEMSLVGPRPLPLEYLSIISVQEHRRHQVRPGITGWCQVNGRNALSWDQKFDLDLHYRQYNSLLFDLRILAKTPAGILHSWGQSPAVPLFLNRQPQPVNQAS